MHQFSRAAAALPFLLTVLAGCHDDPVDPCAREFACQVQGIDLEIVKLEIVAMARDAETGLGIVDADSVDYVLTVRNRGDSVSVDGRAVIRYGYGQRGDTVMVLFDGSPEDTARVPPLRPGTSVTLRGRIGSYDTSDHPRHGEWYDDTAYAEGRLLLQDADTSNNLRFSGKVHVRVAVLDISLVPEDTSLTINVPFAAHLSIRNVSRHGAMPPLAVGFFTFNFTMHQIGGPDGFGTHDMPALPPGHTYQRDLTLTISPSSAWNNKPYRYILTTTIAPLGAADTALWRHYISPLRYERTIVTVHPNYRACDPPLLVLDSAVIAPYVCKNPFSFYVFEILPRTDREYSIEQPDPPVGASIHRPDGSLVSDVYPGSWFAFPVTAPFYILDFVNRSDTTRPRVMILRDRPATQSNSEGWQ